MFVCVNIGHTLAALVECIFSEKPKCNLQLLVLFTLYGTEYLGFGYDLLVLTLNLIVMLTSLQSVKVCLNFRKTVK